MRSEGKSATNSLERVSPGVYRRQDGKFLGRPTIRGKRTWRVLKARTRRFAIEEYLKLDGKQYGGALLSEIAQEYIAHECPSSTGRRKAPKTIEEEKRCASYLLRFFKNQKAEAIGLRDCFDYHRWRVKELQQRGKPGHQATDKELVTLSNIMTYGVMRGYIESNKVKHGRPKFTQRTDVTSCRDHSPRSTQELHDVAAMFFEAKDSQVLGWQLLFEALTGCRTTEILSLRTDAGPGQPGYIESGKWLHIQRAKSGRNPYVPILPELDEAIKAHAQWKRKRHPKSPWYFPSPRNHGSPIDKGALGHGLRRLRRQKRIRHLTSHGMRAFYVEWRRSQKASDAQIAMELGHQSGGAALIWTTYGNKPPNWEGGPDLSFDGIKRSWESII